MTLTIDDVFRDNVIKGDVHSGKHDPSKSEFRRLWKQTFGGAAAVGDYRGAWNSATAYVTADFVEYNGSLWIADRANTNVTPVDGADWSLLLPGTSVADGAISEPKLAPSLKVALDATVADRTSLASLTGFSSAKTRESGLEGDWTLKDYAPIASVVDTDTRKGIYVRSTSDASKVWARPLAGPVYAAWYGCRAGETAANNTAAINAAINTGRQVILPYAEFNVDAGVGKGIVVRDRTKLKGQGRLGTIMNARNGGDLGQLQNYLGGSVIRREFDPLNYNQYVQGVEIEDLSIVLNHPLAAITSTAIQIGVDFRNVTRSAVRRCHIGNYHPDLAIDAKGSSASYLVQGYAVVCGNVAGTPPPYAGGEGNTIEDNFIAGAYRAVCIDDNVLSPSSAAYSTRVWRNDIQLAQILVYQASSYGAGNTIKDNILQACVVRNGNPDTITAGIWINGYGNTIDESYGEYGNCTYILRLHTQAHNNRARYSGTCSATNGLITEGSQRAFVDSAGGSSKNIVEFFADTGAFGANGHDSFGNPIRMVSGARTTVT